MSEDSRRDQDFVTSVTPDVMRRLREKRFFEALDDLLCPSQTLKAPAACHGDYTHSKRILVEMEFDSIALDDIFAVLANQGGLCDCEILYNAAETSRLKAKYWRSQGVTGSSSLHHGEQKR